MQKLLSVCLLSFQIFFVVTIFSLFYLLFTPKTFAQCATLPTDTGKVTTTFNASENGLYTVWSRMQAASSTNDSFWLQIDEECPIIVGDSGLTPNVWTWVNYRDGDTGNTITANLTAGSHTITLVGRESGVKIDRVIFLGNQTCTPTGTGDDCVTQSTASINATPSSGTITQGTPFTVDIVVDGGGQAFNAAEATVTVSANLSVTSLTESATNPCNFSYTGTAPSVSNPSFAGAILSGSSTQCTVYRLTLSPLSAGTGMITLSNASIKAYSNNSEILQSTQNGSYTLTISPSITPVSTNTPVPPSATQTPAPTQTPSPTPTRTPTPTLTPTPTPTATPAPTISLSPVLTPPVITLPRNLTFQTSSFLTGNKKVGETISVNGSNASVVYPSSTSWQVVRPLAVGDNEFNIVSVDNSGNQSEATTVILRRHKLGDINGDTLIDLTDLSLFAADWQKTNNFSNILSDNNEDGRVNLSDFSILAKQYGR